MSEVLNRLCSALKEASDTQQKASETYQKLLTTIEEFIEGMPKTTTKALRNERTVISDLIAEQKKQGAILSILYNAHCGESE